jgi:hypothetical protein
MIVLFRQEQDQPTRAHHSTASSSFKTPSSLSTTPRSSSMTSPSTHLSYPSPSILPLPTQSPSPSQPRPLLQDRLYVGNLHPTVDEHVTPFSSPPKAIQPMRPTDTPCSKSSLNTAKSPSSTFSSTSQGRSRVNRGGTRSSSTQPQKCV